MASSPSSSTQTGSNLSDGERDGGVDHGSIAQLLDQLGLGEMDPESVFDFTEELPGILLSCGEHVVQEHDPATGGDPGFGAVADKKSFWVKVSSADGLSDTIDKASPQLRAELADGHPLYVYVMPTTPLEDVQRISVMPRTNEEISIRICNKADVKKKLSALNKVKVLLDEIDRSRSVMGLHVTGLRQVTQQRFDDAQEAKVRYHQAKAAYEAAKADAEAEGGEEAQGRVEAEYIKVLAASGRLLVAREVHLAMVQATVHMSDLEESLSAQAAKLEQAMRRLTFMGCADA